VADRGDSDRGQILGGQLGQDFGVDIVIAERVYVALQPQLA
jgi:hypothetical protein